MEFIFRINNEIIYRTKLQSIRCIEHVKNGTQCKRKTVMGSPLCYTHLLYKHHLRIKKSNINGAGKGLFAINPLTKDKVLVFRKGDTIVKYNGEIIDEAEVIKRYEEKTGTYVIGISKDRFEDAAKYRGVGSIANTLPGHNNATISVYRGYASLKCTKNIYNGDEIYLSYGPSHKLNQPGVSYSTK